SLRIVSSSTAPFIPSAPRSKRFGYTAHPPHWLTDRRHGPGIEGATRRGGRVGRDCGMADPMGARRPRGRGRIAPELAAAAVRRGTDADADADAEARRRAGTERRLGRHAAAR